MPLIKKTWGKQKKGLFKKAVEYCFYINPEIIQTGQNDFINFFVIGLVVKVNYPVSETGHLAKNRQMTFRQDTLFSQNQEGINVIFRG